MVGPRRRRRGAGPAPRKVQIRLTEAEHQAIVSAAARPGRRVSVARFVAEAALAAADLAPPPSTPRRTTSRLALAEIADATAAVNRVGNNLNQLAREKNATGRRPADTFAEVERALAALDHLAAVTTATEGGP